MSKWEIEATNSKFKDGEAFPIPPAGAHGAVLVAMVDLGTQHDTYQGEARKTHQVYLVWELTGKKMDGYKDRNFLIGRSYTFSMNEKAALRIAIQSMCGKTIPEGKKVELAKLLSFKCLVNVVQQNSKSDPKKVYAKISSLSPVPEGMTIKPAQTKPFLWDLDSGDFDQLKDLPYIFGEPVADVVKASDEFKARAAVPQNGQQAAPAQREPGDEPEEAPDRGAESEAIPF